MSGVCDHPTLHGPTPQGHFVCNECGFEIIPPRYAESGLDEFAPETSWSMREEHQ